jgi:hypothetical protein
MPNLLHWVGKPRDRTCFGAEFAALEYPKHDLTFQNFDVQKFSSGSSGPPPPPDVRDSGADTPFLNLFLLTF